MTVLPQFPVDPDRVTTPVGGRLRHFKDNWFLITEDHWILSVVSGYSPSFISRPLLHRHPKPQIGLAQQERELVTKEIHTLLEKGAILRAKPTDPGYYSNLFIVPKKDGGSRPVINLKALNSHLSIPHFKMEGTQNLKDILTKADYMVKLDLQDVYLSVPMHKDMCKYLRFCWEGDVFEFLSLPFGLGPAPMVFYKAFETSSVLSQTTENTDLGVFGRYTPNGTISERSRDPHPDDNSVASLPGVCPEHEEMPDHSQSNDGVPGFSSRLTEHDSISPRNQSVEDQERMQAHEKPVSRDREAVSSLDRSPDVLLASNLSGTPTLPGTTASQEPGLGSGGYIIRQEDSYVKGCTAGSSLVDSTAVFTNGQTDSQFTTRHGPRNRCVNERMGSEPPQGRNFDRGSLVSKGSYPSHQLARTERGISSSTVLRKEPQQHSHPTEDGQPGGSYICEQEGGNKVEGPLRLSTEAMGLVHQTFDHSGSTSLARTSEHNCRLREPPPDRLKRLESGSSSVQSDH